MNAVFTVAAHEFAAIYERRVFQIITVAFPLIALIGFAAVWFIQNANDGDDGGASAAYGYVDMAGAISGHLDQGRVRYRPYTTFEEGRADLLSDEIDKLFVIPEDYFQSGVVQSFSIDSGFQFDGADSSMRSLLLDNLIAEGAPSDLAARLKRPMSAVHVSLDSSGAPNEVNAPRVFFFLALAFLLFMSLVTTGGFLLQSLGQEKEHRVMEVLLSSVTPARLMIGKILGLGAAGLTQMMIWIAAALILINALPWLFPDLDVALPGIPQTLLAIAFFILGYMLFGTLLAGLGAIATTTQEGQQLSMLVNLPLIIPMYAWYAIVENPASLFTKVLTFFPFTAPIVVFQRLGPGAIEAWEVAASLLILALSVLLAVFIVSRVFRAFLLSYGKRPSIKQLWAALREG